mgnify:CR=1 FL=1
MNNREAAKRRRREARIKVHHAHIAAREAAKPVPMVRVILKDRTAKGAAYIASKRAATAGSGWHDDIAAPGSINRHYGDKRDMTPVTVDLPALVRHLTIRAHRASSNL